METFYVSGSAQDIDSARVEFICDYLVRLLPRLGLVKDLRHPCEWSEFRKYLVESRGFDHPGTSPLVWTGNGRLIGSASDFLQFVKEKYGVDVPIDETLISAIQRENLENALHLALEDSWTPRVGTYTKAWKDGMTFEGSWRDHKPKKGTITFPDGSTYTGSLLNGKFEGSGLRKYTDGSKFRGAFVNGLREGAGKWTDADGNEYDGKYWRDLCHGKGTRKWPNGRTYSGEWKENQATGLGTETNPEGENLHYTGSFLNGQRDGDGVMKYVSGAVYEGKWKEGKRHGSGTMTWRPDKNLVFGGTFENDLPTYGQFTFVGANMTSAFPGEASLSLPTTRARTASSN